VVGVAKLKAKNKAKVPEPKAMPNKRKYEDTNEDEFDTAAVAHTLTASPTLQEELVAELGHCWDAEGGNEPDPDEQEPAAKKAKTQRGTKNRGGKKVQLARLMALLKDIKDGSSSTSSAS
jgi:hypothetical protein